MTDLADYLEKHDDNFRKARLPALYADFRPQKALNPDGFRANVAAWQGALSGLALQGLLSANGTGAFVLVVDDALLQTLGSKRFGQPLALGTAIQDGISTHSFISLMEYSQRASHAESISSFAWAAAQWTFRQFGFASSLHQDDKIPRGRYVILRNVEEAFQKIKHDFADKRSRFDRVFTKVQFRAVASTCLATVPFLTDEDFEVLIIFLSKTKHFIDYDGQVVRVKDSLDHSAINEEDAAIASIKELASNLDHQVSVLNKRIDCLREEAGTALQRQNRVAAKAALRSRKLAEASLATRYATLEQLQNVAANIEQAADQVQLVRVMNSSVGALKSLNSQIGSSSDVEGLMDQVREQMAETDEVAAILAEHNDTIVDESELDAAVEDLEQEVVEASNERLKTPSSTDLQKAQRALASLPEPPSDSIAVQGESAVSGVEAKVAQLSLDEP